MMEELILMRDRLHAMSHALANVRKLYEKHCIREKIYQNNVEVEYQKALLAWEEVDTLINKIKIIKGKE